MPIDFKFPIGTLKSQVSLTDPLKGNNKPWMAWWYCGIYKNHLANSQPNVLVSFREVIDSHHLHDEQVVRYVPLTALGQIRIGTIWVDSVCRHTADFKCEKFDVNFSRGSWNISSFPDAIYHRVSPPFDQNIYPLYYPNDRNYFIEFPI
jgi:hypothetical protein